MLSSYYIGLLILLLWQSPRCPTNGLTVDYSKYIHHMVTYLWARMNPHAQRLEKRTSDGCA